jgi:hypothetical protein
MVPVEDVLNQYIGPAMFHDQTNPQQQQKVTSSSTTTTLGKAVLEVLQRSSKQWLTTTGGYRDDMSLLVARLAIIPNR